MVAEVLEGWVALAEVQLRYLRVLMRLDAEAARDDELDGPLLCGLSFEEREEEIRRRHGELTKRRVWKFEKVSGG